MLAALALLLGSNLLFILESLILYRAYAPAPLLMGRALLAASALLFTELVIFSIAVAIAVFARKVRSVSGTATAIGVGGFLLSALHSMLEEEALRYITVYKYFDVSKAFFEGGFEAPYVATAIVLSLICLGTAWLKYTRSDIPAL